MRARAGRGPGMCLEGEVWYLRPSPLPSSGRALTKRPSLPCHPDGARLENGDLNPKFADVRSCHRHLLRRLCHQQPGARAAFCSLTGFMNFNGQLLLGFSSSSRCFFPLTAFRVTLLLPKTSLGSWPALGILRAPPKTFPSIPPHRPCNGDLTPKVQPSARGVRHGAAGTTVPLLWPVALGTSVAFPEIQWM